MAFRYRFRNGNQIHLTSKASGKNLRIMNDGSVNGQGGTGNFASFVVHKVGGNRIKLQNVANPSKWLRITGTHEINGNGSGGPYTIFRVIKHGDGSISLKSDRFSHKNGHHVGIRPNGAAKAPQNTGTGPHGRFFVSLRNGYSIPHKQKVVKQVFHQMFNQQPQIVTTTMTMPQFNGFRKRFRHGNRIHLKVNHYGKNLRIMNDGTVNGNGGTGKWATFIVHKPQSGYIKLQNVGNPKNWLRIDQNRQLNGNGRGGKFTLFKIVKRNDGSISLESACFPGSFVGINKSGYAKIAGNGPHGRFSVFLQNGTNIQKKVYCSMPIQNQPMVTVTTRKVINNPMQNMTNNTTSMQQNMNQNMMNMQQNLNQNMMNMQQNMNQNMMNMNMQPNMNMGMQPNMNMRMQPNMNMRMQPNMNMNMQPNMNMNMQPNMNMNMQPQVYPNPNMNTQTTTTTKTTYTENLF